MNYETVMGLEIHCELSTKTKLFCGCSTKFGNEPNENCCPGCFGLPGILPVLNKRAVEYGVRAGLATNCTINMINKFDRKSYFYPDLSVAYQTSQFVEPICLNGYVEIEVNGENKKIRLNRIHIEEDAGKLVHESYGTGLDFNRLGVVLIEIVTEPDFRNPDEVKAFIETLRNILQYIDVSDCKMEQGSLRCDVNLSIRTFGSKKFGTRVETKNLNSIKSILRSIEHETKRQIHAVENNIPLIQQTRRWDDEKGDSYPMRNKEQAEDYRYFPEPNIPPVSLSTEFVEEIRKNMPELPNSRKSRYVNEYNLPVYDAEILVSTRVLSDFFEEGMKSGADAKLLSNLVMGDILRCMKEKNSEIIPFSGKNAALLLEYLKSGKINQNGVKQVINFMFDENKTPDEIIKEHQLGQVSDMGEIQKIVSEVIEENPQSVQDYKNGKEKAVTFLVGQIMRKSKGKANPKIVNELVKTELNR